jgi:hypothetical protein
LASFLFFQSVLKTGSNLLKDCQSWKGLSRRERKRVATSLVVNMEETGFQIAYSIDVGEPPVISRDANICKLNFIKLLINRIL